MTPDFLCADVCEWQACEIMAELVEGLQSILSLGHHRNSIFPAFLTSPLRNIVISLSRLPLVNSYTRVPPLVSEREMHAVQMHECLGVIFLNVWCAGLETGLVPTARRRILYNTA